MTEDVAVIIPQSIYQRARQLAQARNQPVNDVLVSVLDKGLPSADAINDEAFTSRHNEAAIREMKAYIAMHPRLKENYFGMHVAIHKGKLIDYDQDYDALYKRIDEQFPDEFVWLATVEEEPLPTLVFRSPRFIHNE